MKGIILAGGAGTRLYPLTKITSKQLLPIYDRPMVYYPLQTLVDGGIHDILLISDPINIGNFVRLLGSGKELGVRISYEVQDDPRGGLAQAILIGDNFIDDEPVTLILGDNLFISKNDFLAQSIATFRDGARVFAKEVSDPERFGVVEFDDHNQAVSIEEKPTRPKSNFAVTGLYIYDPTAVAKAKTLKPSERGQLEITDLNRLYLDEKKLDVQIYDGHWLDTGTFDSLLEASVLVASIRKNSSETTGS